MMRASKFEPTQPAGQTKPRGLLKELENGDVLEVTDRTGHSERIDLRRICADGELLTSPQKAWICDPIRESVRHALDSMGGSGPVAELIVQRANAQMLWAYWVVDHQKTADDVITGEDVEQFLRESEGGLDALFGAREKVWRALKSLERSDGRNAAMGATTREIFLAARIPFTLIPQLPAALAVVKEYKAGVRTLPQWKGTTNKLKANSLSFRALAVRDLYPHFQEGEADATAFDDALRAVVRGIGKSKGTKLIPHELGMRLLEQAAFWVVKVVPAVIQLRNDLLEAKISAQANVRSSEHMKVRRRILAEANARLDGVLPEPLVFKRESGKGIAVSSIVRTLAPAADYIITAGTTARRKREMESLREGACFGNEATGYWMQTYIGKTLQRDDITPCPRIAATAVEQLEELSKDWREKTGSDSLLNIPFLEAQSVSKFDSLANLNKFAKLVGATEYSTNRRKAIWKYTPHQLRKLFAVLYVWRYDAGDIYALSYHLRHFNLRMTLRYCLDAELIREITSQTAALTKGKLRDYARGAVKKAGVYAKRLERLIGRFLGDIRLVAERDLDKALTRIIGEKKISLKATPWGYCGCSSAPSNLRRAACQRSDCPSRGTDFDGTPDPTGSDEVRCAGCYFFATDSTRFERWEAASREAKGIVDDAASARLQVIKFENRLKVVMSIQEAIGGDA